MLFKCFMAGFFFIILCTLVKLYNISTCITLFDTKIITVFYQSFAFISLVQNVYTFNSVKCMKDSIVRRYILKLHLHQPQNSIHTHHNAFLHLMLPFFKCFKYLLYKYTLYYKDQSQHWYKSPIFIWVIHTNILT